ncbi:hypothetical protein [Methanospirillum hungatei]|uniref:hypothetical protein n=1 Tax=Methanospirillum hungatei TaxID=2203 RepID=UPI0026F30F80|nr:hypothetical protein [Methanospirillum hungatei]MCA1916985.1 hypothetical protein [Methanospirillum hungatei]
MNGYNDLFSGIFVILAFMLVIVTVSGSDPNYDPVTRRTYDSFGSFFDEYNQYIDTVNNVVLDRYGGMVHNGYNFNSDSYIDSKGNLYGSRELAGKLKEGQWIFPGNYAGATPIDFTKRADGVKDIRRNGCLVIESPDPVPKSMDTKAIITGYLPYEADWLPDGRDIVDTPPQPTSKGQPIGPTPYDGDYFDWLKKQV